VTTRFIDEAEAVKAAAKGPAAFQKWLARQPRAPRLVRRKEAAKILGVQSPHITRFIRQDRMPEPVEIGGGLNVYLLDEVEAFAKELAEERVDAERRAEERRRQERLRAIERKAEEEKAAAEKSAVEKRERKREADRRYRERKRKEKDG
jgi:predicted DNA-binding transcriptional regulator AlpA